MTAFRRIPVAAIGTLVLSALLLGGCHYGHRYHGGHGYHGYYPRVYAHPHKPHRYHHRRGYRYRHY